MTLLGLVKRATFVERIWFGEAVTCRSRTEIGIPATPDESFWRAMRPLILWLAEQLAAT